MLMLADIDLEKLVHLIGFLRTWSCLPFCVEASCLEITVPVYVVLDTCN